MTTHKTYCCLFLQIKFWGAAMLICLEMLSHHSGRVRYLGQKLYGLQSCKYLLVDLLQEINK